MTHTEVQEMEAGPKLNEQMAMLVKGWKPHPTGHPEQWFNLPDYSHNISLAWEVLCHQRRNGWYHEMYSYGGPEGGWRVSTDNQSDPDATHMTVSVENNNLALAICRAALATTLPPT